jgi:hypothetical protein
LISEVKLGIANSAGDKLQRPQNIVSVSLCFHFPSQLVHEA